jgi:hypothetical protein
MKDIGDWECQEIKTEENNGEGLIDMMHIEGSESNKN